MVALIILLLLLGLIFSTPVKVHLHYNRNGFRYRLYLGRFKLPEFGKKKPKKQKTPSAAPAKKRNEGASFEQMMQIAKFAIELFEKLKFRFKVTRFLLRIRCGGENASAVAVSYGLIWAALGNAAPLLQKIFDFRDPRVDISCDYKKKETQIVCNAVVGVTVGRLLWWLVGAFIKLKMNSKKAVQ